METSGEHYAWLHSKGKEFSENLIQASASELTPRMPQITQLGLFF